MIDITTYDSIQSELASARTDRDAKRAAMDAAQTDYDTANERVIALEAAVTALGAGVVEVKTTLAERAAQAAAPVTAEKV